MAGQNCCGDFDGMARRTDSRRQRITDVFDINFDRQELFRSPLRFRMVTYRMSDLSARSLAR